MEKGKNITAEAGDRLWPILNIFSLSPSLSLFLSLSFQKRIKLYFSKGENNLYSACSTLNCIKQITTKCEGSKLGNISHNAAFVVYCF